MFSLPFFLLENIQCQINTHIQLNRIQLQSIFIATLLLLAIVLYWIYYGFPFIVNRLIVFDSIDLLSISYARISLFLFI